MKKLWTLMLVLLAVVAAQAQDGYWKLFDKRIEPENNGEHFEGVKMEGQYGRFTMRSKLLEHGQRGYYTDHKDCYGEWLYCIITYTEPLKYYAPGDTITSTYQTTTTHSDRVCGVWFADGPGITGDIWTVQNSSGTFLSNVRLENKEGNRYVNPQRKDNHYTDVKETVSAVIPKGNSRDSVMAIYFGFAHGRGEDAVYIRYYYKWTEGSKPVEKLYSINEMMKQEKKSGPGKWIWIPVVVGIGSIGVGTTGVCVYWLRRRIKKRKAKFTDKDKEELRKLHEGYQEAQLNEGKDAMKWDTFKGVGEWTSWGLDIAGDVSTAILANTVGAAGTPVMGKGMQTGVAALKTFLKGMATDYANDKNLLSFNTIGQNLTKAGADAAKTFLTCGTVGNAPSAAIVESGWSKLGLNVGVDTTTTFITDLWEGKSLGETGKDVAITVFKSAANTGLGELIGKVKWTNMQLNNETWKLEKVINTATDATADATTDAVANAVADAANRIIIEKVGNPAAEKGATTIAEGGIDWISQKVEDWFGGKK